MWNNLDLRPPPINSYRSDVKSVDSLLLKGCLQEFISKISSCKKALYTEAALLSRILYRLKTKFRGDIGLKYLDKTDKTLHKYIDLDIVKDMNNFLKSMPVQQSGEVYFPTKQMLEYVIVRLQGFSKIISRMIDNSSDTAKYMTNRMTLGHFWNVALIILASVSRVWKICMYIIDVCSSCYKNLLKIHKQLKLHGARWLDTGYEFPTDLRRWLDVRLSKEDLQNLTLTTLNIPIYVLSDEDDDDIQFMFQYKNDDCIVIDDTLQVADNDVQFVNEYIEIMENDRKKKRTETIVEIDSDATEPIKNDCTEFSSIYDLSDTNNDVSQNLFDVADDIGEKVSRKRKRKKIKINSTELNIQNQVFEKMYVQESVINNHSLKKQCSNKLIVLGNQPENNSYVNIHDRTLQGINNKSNDVYQGRECCLSRVAVPKEKNDIKNTLDNQIGIMKKSLNRRASCDNYSDKSECKKFNASITCHSTPKESKIIQNNIGLNKADSKVTKVKQVNVSSSHNLDNVTTIREFNHFLEKEKELRRKKHSNRLTINLSKSRWCQLQKSLKNIFAERKSLNQDKKNAVKMAKTLIEYYINSY